MLAIDRFKQISEGLKAVLDANNIGMERPDEKDATFFEQNKSILNWTTLQSQLSFLLLIQSIHTLVANKLLDDDTLCVASYAIARY